MDSVLVIRNFFADVYAFQCGDDAEASCEKMIKEVHRVLHKEVGVYIVVSYGTPENRECYLKKVKSFNPSDLCKIAGI